VKDRYGGIIANVACDLMFKNQSLGSAFVNRSPILTNTVPPIINIPIKTI